MLGKGETEAAELAGMMIGKSDKTICKWRSNFFESEVPHSKQGQYQGTCVLWKNEDLNKKAENAAVKGKQPHCQKILSVGQGPTVGK